jgi:hypothetical protein
MVIQKRKQSVSGTYALRWRTYVRTPVPHAFSGGGVRCRYGRAGRGGTTNKQTDRKNTALSEELLHERNWHWVLKLQAVLSNNRSDVR